MATILSKGNLFPPKVVDGMINNVRGKSSLAKLCAQTPLDFNGQTEYVFTFDKEVDIVAENGAKTVGGGTATAVTVTPIKFEYSMRVSDEFMTGSEEYQLNIMKQFAEGFAKKLARGLDLAAFHGVNPRTASASAVVGTNNFDSAVSTTVTYAAATADDNLNDAIAAITNNSRIVTGIAMSPTMGTDMSKIKANGVVQYPEFRFGQAPDNFANMILDINETVSANSSDDRAIVGDFQNMFKWGYSKNIFFDVIEYGNPDNDATLGDLKGHNQVLLRSEAFIGWGILDAASFVRIEA